MLPRSNFWLKLNILDIDDKDAVNKHYELLAAIMRVICAAVLSRGSQNEHTLEQGRKFLMENRLSILAVLKKSAGLGGVNNDTSGQSIAELAESFILLITLTGFLEVSTDLEFLNRSRLASL
jgi:nuclear pore complex protein Nup205